jgi:asparagine synthase (glutamine-hydrolysing)
MCGIAGIISSNQDLVTTQRLRAMTQSLAHRGPDGEGHYINPAGSAGLGHRRLSIIDLSEAAAQPMHYADRYVIVHNGEIYNYKELRKSLQQKGYAFRTQSDTEVITAAYDCYGKDCLQQFDGMYAFAIWDEKEQELFAARDRFGEKPFFFFIDEEQFVFASEIKALWRAGVEKKMNERLLFNYLTLGYTSNPGDQQETFFSNILKLPARHFLQYRLSGHELSIELYWDIDATSTTKPSGEEAAIATFKELFTNSVSVRLRSDVPIGNSLSGGLDSSSVLSTMTRLTNAGYKTFSATFPGFEKDESEYIRKAAWACGAENIEVQISEEEIINDFEKICYHQDEPFQSSSVWAQFSVYEAARRYGVKVLLDGQGADELLAGYYKYYHWYWQELYRTDKAMLERELAAARQLGVQEPWGLKNKLAALFPSQGAAILSRQRIRAQKQHPDLRSEFVAAYGQSYYHTPHMDSLNGVLYYNTFLNGLEELLRYADRNAMAHGVEVRLPFLQHELAAFIFSLPSTCKIREGRTKWILRKAMEGKVPDAIIQRTDKIGFEPPQQQWMNNKRLQEYMREAMRGLEKEGILQTGVADKKIQPRGAHAADNYQWRYLLAGRLLL